jgi:predicted esterase YcpF (UPF0227 family)
MNKCLLIIQSQNILEYNNYSSLQNYALKKKLNIRIIEINITKNNYRDNFSHLERLLNAYSKKYKIYILSTSFGGYFAKQLFEKNSLIIEKIIYLTPIFSPQKFFENTKLFNLFFEFIFPIPKTNKWNNKKEFLILSQEDNIINSNQFSKNQIKNSFYNCITRVGLIQTSSDYFINKIYSIIIL